MHLTASLFAHTTDLNLTIEQEEELLIEAAPKRIGSLYQYILYGCIIKKYIYIKLGQESLLSPRRRGGRFRPIVGNDSPPRAGNEACTRYTKCRALFLERTKIDLVVKSMQQQQTRGG